MTRNSSNNRNGAGASVNSYNRLLDSADSAPAAAESRQGNECTPLSSAEGSSSLPNSSSAIGERIVVTVLDMKQQKFRVSADPNWTVSQFKVYSSSIHQVPADSQRLIYMGKLLKNEETLRDSRITESDRIVHLFPKPKMIVKATQVEEDAEVGDASDAEDAPAHAHIPQIVVDETFYSTIITTNELFEAQQRVKLLSFVLLIISSMELLTLVTIFLGPDVSGGNTSFNTDDVPPGDPTDYVSPTHHGAEEEQMRSWRQTDYIDVVVSAAGVYVALLGLKASTENTPALALQYCLGLVGVGCAWLGYYFYVGVLDGTKNADSDVNEREVYVNAATGLTIPCIIWVTCFIRAFQFRSMIIDAQREALERHEAQHRSLQGDEGNNDLTLTEIV